MEEIIKFINNSPQRSIFCYPWWLEIVAPRKYQYICVKKQERIDALLPVIINKKTGLKLCNMPAFTQYLGVLLPEMTGKYTAKLSSEHQLMDKLIDKLPYCIYYNLKFHFTIKNWLPFYWKGFTQTTKYTYLLDNIKQQDEIWNNMRQNIRRAIRKAQNIVEVVETKDPEIMVTMHKKTMKKNKRKVTNIECDKIRNIYHACNERNCGKLLMAKDKDGNIHSCQLFVWDDRMAYYLIGGNDPEFMSSGAASYVMWEGIRQTSEIVNEFSFEGSMIPSIERFFRAFGGRQTPYFAINKYSSKLLSVYGGLKNK